MNLQAIFIEAGHGKKVIMHDPGAIGKYKGKKVTEREISVNLARAIFLILKEKPELKNAIVQDVGIETSANVRAKTRFINKVIKTNKLKPEKCIAVAIHVNGNYDVSGFEGFYQTKKIEGKPILSSILQAMHKYFPDTPIRKLMPSKDSRFGRLYIDDVVCPYILVETGFIGNQNDLEQIIDQKDRMAEAIAHGILEYIRKR